MFYIPETKEETMALIKEIANRVAKGPNDVSKLDYFYTIALMEAVINDEFGKISTTEIGK